MAYAATAVGASRVNLTVADEFGGLRAAQGPVYAGGAQLSDDAIHQMGLESASQLSLVSQELKKMKALSGSRSSLGALSDDSSARRNGSPASLGELSEPSLGDEAAPAREVHF